MIDFQRTRHSILVACRRCGRREVFATVDAAGAESWARSHADVEDQLLRDNQTRLAIAASRARSTRRDRT